MVGLSCRRLSVKRDTYDLVKRTLILPLVALQALLGVCLAPAADDFDRVVARHRDRLVAETVANESGSTPETRDPAVWVKSLAADGRWADIDYASRAGAAWPAVAHLRRVRTLARTLAAEKSPQPGDMETERTALRALEHWTTVRYQNPNWWQNEIGVPQVMRDIIVLLDRRLTGPQREAAFAVLHQFKLQPAGFGANTVWTGELALMTGALERDEAAVAAASRLIAGEITLGGAQGIQADFSFHQHGARLQQFHYGSSFLKDTVRVAWLLRDTPWAFPAEKAGLLADLAEQGSAWMLRGTATVPGTLDRAVSRPGALGSADLRPELAMLADLLPTRRAALAALGRKQAGAEAPVAGFRAFPRSDFATYHRPAFSFFLKTVSNRTEVTESIVRENRLGRKLNWGDHYFLTRTGNYTDLPPVWNWDLLPGVTSSTDLDSLQRQSFVGALGDGESGLAAMDYRVGRAEVTRLTARKFWATHGDVVVALIGALDVTAPGEPVRTALDQRRLQGEVTVATARGIKTLPAGEHRDLDARWLHHDGLLYVPLAGQSLSLVTGPTTGSWQTINLNHSAAPVTASLFVPVLEHGREPRQQAGGFAVLACPTPKDAARLMKRPSWTVLQNDTALQAVRFADGTVMASFYAAGALPSAAGLAVEVRQPCLLLISRGKLRLSDPTQLGTTVELMLGKRSLTVTCPVSGGASEPIRL